MKAKVAVTVSMFSFAFVVLFVSGCSKDEPVQPQAVTTGTLRGTVTDVETASAISGVRILLFDANTNAPLVSFASGNDGSFGLEIDPGTYFLKFSKQGYEELPPKDISPLPLGILAGQVTDYSVQMFKSAIINGGGISGKVVANGTGIPGVLVVAESGVDGFSAGTDVSGNYAIYNVPANSYTVKAWYSDHNSNVANVTVTAGTEQSNVDLTLTQGVTGAVTGQISFLATTNAEVDVALLNPLSRETIPGLSVMTVSQDFTIQNVPDGTYLARATYRNDGKVVDPDWIIKNGEPYVTVLGGSVSRDFSVTGAVELLSPTNSPTRENMDTVTVTFAFISYSPLII